MRRSRVRVQTFTQCTCPNPATPEYVQRYATKEALDASDGKKAEEEDEDEEMSDVGSISDMDE